MTDWKRPDLNAFFFFFFFFLFFFFWAADVSNLGRSQLFFFQYEIRNLVYGWTINKTEHRVEEVCCTKCFIVSVMFFHVYFNKQVHYKLEKKARKKNSKLEFCWIKRAPKNKRARQFWDEPYNLFLYVCLFVCLFVVVVVVVFFFSLTWRTNNIPLKKNHIRELRALKLVRERKSVGFGWHTDIKGVRLLNSDTGRPNFPLGSLWWSHKNMFCTYTMIINTLRQVCNEVSKKKTKCLTFYCKVVAFYNLWPWNTNTKISIAETPNLFIFIYLFYFIFLISY